jgi:hypothetical protein
MAENGTFQPVAYLPMNNRSGRLAFSAAFDPKRTSDTCPEARLSNPIRQLIVVIVAACTHLKANHLEKRDPRIADQVEQCDRRRANNKWRKHKEFDNDTRLEKRTLVNLQQRVGRKLTPAISTACKTWRPI